MCSEKRSIVDTGLALRLTKPQWLDRFDVEFSKQQEVRDVVGLQKKETG